MSAESLNLMPRAQAQAWRHLVTMLPALPQGLILVGPAGVGKRRAARALFQLLNCENAGRKPAPAEEASLFGGPAPEPSAEGAQSHEPCGTCVSCRKIAEGKHTDIVEIAPRGDAIAVDDLRELKKSLHFSPLESPLRFVIIDEAHRLNAASANTLLKTLEEPPAHTRFFLITHERGLLLPTIVSRCQFIHFAPLDDETLRELLAVHGHEIPDRLLKTCLGLLAGGMERARALSDDKTLEFLENAQKHLAVQATRPTPASWDEIAQFSDGLAGAGDGQDWKIELLLDLITALGHRNALAGRSPRERLKFARRALEAAYLRRRLERHANKKLIALAAADLAAGAAAHRPPR